MSHYEELEQERKQSAALRTRMREMSERLHKAEYYVDTLQAHIEEKTSEERAELFKALPVLAELYTDVDNAPEMVDTEPEGETDPEYIAEHPEEARADLKED